MELRDGVVIGTDAANGSHMLTLQEAQLSLTTRPHAMVPLYYANSAASMRSPYLRSIRLSISAHQITDEPKHPWSLQGVEDMLVSDSVY